jgi:hypothetical protein
MTSSLLSPYLRQVVSGRQVFFWEVYEGKYRTGDRAGRRLDISTCSSLQELDERPPFIFCRPGKKRYYAPLRDNPVLHRTFCSISDEKGIAAFASKYGMLGFSSIRIIKKRRNNPPERLVAESLNRWRYELAEMQRLLHLWDLVKKRRLSLISALVNIEVDGLYIMLSRRKDLVADRDSALYKKWVLKGEQPREAAVLYLTNCINSRLEGGVHPQVNPSYRKHIYLHPGNLLTAMWLMFLWELIGEVRPFQCPGCHEWFDPKRSTRKTCGDRCRKRLSRRNRKACN